MKIIERSLLGRFRLVALHPTKPVVFQNSQLAGVIKLKSFDLDMQPITGCASHG